MSDPGWLVQQTENGEPHVVPEHDLRVHLIEEYCWCEPWYEDGITVHNARDGRAQAEPRRTA